MSFETRRELVVKSAFRLTLRRLTLEYEGEQEVGSRRLRQSAIRSTRRQDEESKDDEWSPKRIKSCSIQ